MKTLIPQWLLNELEERGYKPEDVKVWTFSPILSMYGIKTHDGQEFYFVIPEGEM